MLASRAFRLAAAVLAACAACAACAGDEEGPPIELGRVLEPAAPTVYVSPGGTRPVGFVLRALDGAPVADAPVTFAIVDDPDTPGVEAQGATLGSARGTTDAMGVAQAQVTAGLQTVFRVRAASGDAEAEVEIVVGPDNNGSVDVAPVFPRGSRAAAAAAAVEILFFDNSACADVPIRHPPLPARMVRRIAPQGAITRFEFVAVAYSHAIVGRARDDQGAVLALGCVDLPGVTLVAGGAVQVALPLADATPDPVGRFAVTSSFDLGPLQAAAAALAAPWRDLGDCPLDPAQLWLDCTVDALSGAASGDPIDCVPATAAGAEGALGDALGARRGAFLPGPDGSPTACRGARDAGGAVSVDGVALGLFGSPLPRALVELGAIADDAAHLLDTIEVRSELDVRPGVRADAYQVTHTLIDVVFGVREARREVALQPLALPALSAATTAAVRGDALAIDAHGLTLRLGSAARVAFGTLGLGQRALPGETNAFVRALAAMAHSEDGARTGCAALDGALCAEVGRAAGCLVAACDAGLDALARKLDAGFVVADGAGLDLFLAGEAPLLDRHGNGFADRMGDFEASPRQPGAWTADLRTQAGRAVVSGEWQGVRTGN